MSLRSVRERWLQICAYEFVGLAVAAPLYGVVFGGGATEGAVVIIALFLPELLWSVMHNATFDWVEWRYARRVASSRPHRWRVIHAVSHEVTSTVISLPVIMLVTDHGIMGALVVDLWLGVFYAVYAYLFHIVFDWLRPVPPLVVETVLRQEQPQGGGP
jgi:uncharacterized membrane protein